MMKLQPALAGTLEPALFHHFRTDPMTTLHDLPTELLLQIVGYLRMHNQHEPIIGGNAAWTSVPKFLSNEPPFPVPEVLDFDITLDEEDEEQDSEVIKPELERAPSTNAEMAEF